MIQKLKNKLNGDIHLKEILTGSAITFVLKMTGMLLGYFVILIISRQYGAEGIGIYSLTLSFITLVAMIASMGINVSILRYVGQLNKEGKRNKLKKLYYDAIQITFPISITLGVFLFIYSDKIALEVFENSSYVIALKIAACIIPFMTILNISVEFIRGLKKLKVSEFLRSVNRPIVNIGLLIIIGNFVINQMLALYTRGVSVIVNSVIAVVYVLKNIPSGGNMDTDNLTKKELLSTSLPMMITGISIFLIGNLPLFVLEAFVSTSVVGIYSVAVKIATIVSLVLIVVNTISAPKFSELYWNKRYKELQKVLHYSAKLIFLTALLITVIIILFRENILVVFGDEFNTGEFVLVLLVFGQLMNAMTGSVGTLLNMTGHQKILQYFAIAMVLLSLVLNYLLIPLYGIYGAAAATMIVNILFTLIPAVYVKVKLGFRTYYMPWVKYQ